MAWGGLSRSAADGLAAGQPVAGPVFTHPHTEGVDHPAMTASTANGNAADLPSAAAQMVSAPPGPSQGGGGGGPPEASSAGAAAAAVAASSSLTHTASNGNRVNLRSHDGISATPPPSSDFSTMGSDVVADLQEIGATEQEDQGSIRQPQENDERQPQEHDDQQ